MSSSKEQAAATMEKSSKEEQEAVVLSASDAIALKFFIRYTARMFLFISTVPMHPPIPSHPVELL